MASLLGTTRAEESGPELSVVVPLYDEDPVLPELFARLARVLEAEPGGYEIVPVDDGSRDGTAEFLAALAEADPRVRPIYLSRNFGHQAAISAGLDSARGRAVIVMDGDLQDPPEELPALVAKWRGGADVVYAVRRTREGSWPKRVAYRVFYRLLRAVSELEIPLDSGDFGLMDREVVDLIKHLPERLRFVRGLRSFVGFRQVPHHYDRPERASGTAKYSLRALLRLATDGLVSFSGVPLQAVTYLGVFAAIVATGLTTWVFADALGAGSAPRGWASTMIVVLFMNAILMLNQGILGAYVRRIFLEVKGRPTYIARSRPPRGPGSVSTPPPPHFQPARRPIGAERAGESSR